MKDISYLDPSRFPETSWRRAQRRRLPRYRNIIRNALIFGGAAACLYVAVVLLRAKWMHS